MDARLPKDQRLFAKSVATLYREALRMQVERTRNQGSTENVKPMEVIAMPQGSAQKSLVVDAKPCMGALELVLASGEWESRFFVLGQNCLTWFTDRAAYERHRGQQWCGRILLKSIGQFIIAPDGLNMDIVTTASPYPHRYKLRSPAPGVLRTWAECATLMAPAGSARYQGQLPREELLHASGAAKAANPLQDSLLPYMDV